MTNEHHRQTMIPRDKNDTAPLSQAAIEANRQFVSARLASLTDEIELLKKNARDWLSPLPVKDLANEVDKPEESTVVVLQPNTSVMINIPSTDSAVFVKHTEHEISGYIKTPSLLHRDGDSKRVQYFSGRLK